MPKKTQSQKTNEDSLDVIARNVAELSASIADLSVHVKTKVATKKDLLELETRIREDMATKEGLKDLENKLIEDTGVITGVEGKHHRSLTQRVSRLEKHVFPNKHV